jgi:hypothetical protein
MSNKSNCNFKKSKNPNAQKHNSKNFETSHTTLLNQAEKKNIDYHKQLEGASFNFSPSENIMGPVSENLLNEKKNFEVIPEE